MSAGIFGMGLLLAASGALAGEDDGPPVVFVTVHADAFEQVRVQAYDDGVPEADEAAPLALFELEVALADGLGDLVETELGWERGTLWKHWDTVFRIRDLVESRAEARPALEGTREFDYLLPYRVTTHEGEIRLSVDIHHYPYDPEGEPVSTVELVDTYDGTPTSFFEASGRLVARLAPELARIVEAERNRHGFSARLPIARFDASLVAPGKGNQAYELFELDTSMLEGGGTIRVEIEMGDGVAAGSFDLFPPGAAIPSVGRPDDAVAGAYDVAPGEKAELTYDFATGGRFTLGATGNWYSPLGSTNTAELTVRVTGR